MGDGNAALISGARDRMKTSVTSESGLSAALCRSRSCAHLQLPEFVSDCENVRICSLYRARKDCPLPGFCKRGICPYEYRSCHTDGSLGPHQLTAPVARAPRELHSRSQAPHAQRLSPPRSRALRVEAIHNGQKPLAHDGRRTGVLALPLLWVMTIRAATLHGLITSAPRDQEGGGGLIDDRSQPTPHGSGVHGDPGVAVRRGGGGSVRDQPGHQGRGVRQAFHEKSATSPSSRTRASPTLLRP